MNNENNITNYKDNDENEDTNLDRNINTDNTSGEEEDTFVNEEGVVRNNERKKNSEENSDDDEEEDEDENKKYNNAFEQYLKMKNNYLKGQGKKCIKCGNNSGSIFQFKDGKYIAKCGNLSKPCKLNIELQRGYYISKDEYRRERLKKYNVIANNIIQLKLDYLFQFKSESVMVDEFEKLKKQLKEYSDTTENITDKDNFENKLIEQEISSYKEDIKEVKNKIQNNIQEYRTNTNNKTYIRNIIEIYKEELIPLVEQHRKEIYDYVNMEKIKGSYQSMFVKTMLGIRSKEIATVKPKIISFVR